MSVRLVAASVLVVATLTASANADNHLSPEQIAALKAHNEAIVAAEPKAAGVFEVQNDGSIRHIQSGMICPASFPNVSFWHAEVFSDDNHKGEDVGCDYGRNDKNGTWVEKFTIFAVKSAPGTTLDSAFETYRGQVIQTFPNAVSIGVAIKLEDKGAGSSSALPKCRSEAFSVDRDVGQTTEELIVSIQGGWDLEIRNSYFGKPNNIVVNKGEDDAAVKAVGDRIISAFAFVSVSPTLGK